MSDLYSEIQEAIVKLDEDKLASLTDQIVQSGKNPLEAIEKGYTVGIQRVGKLFESGDYFLPELVGAAQMTKEALAKIEKLIPKGGMARKGKVLMGTVAGDIHNIGKDLVIMWLSTRGFDVVDIGVDCPVDRFIDRAIEEKADIIGASCLLTMTAPEQKKLVERMKERGVRNQFKVIIGGAAVDDSWSKQIGADGYAGDLAGALELVTSLFK